MAEKASKQSTPRRFLTDALAHLRRMSRKKSIPFDIDLDYISDLWIQQVGRCAITGTNMSHVRNDLSGVRIDAIEPNKGFIKENIQLVCDGVKRMKRDMSNDEVIRFIGEVRDVILI